MKTIHNTPTGQIVRDVFGDRPVSGEEMARFLIGLAMMKAEEAGDGRITIRIIEEFAKVFDAQNEVIHELKQKATP